MDATGTQGVDASLAIIGGGRMGEAILAGLISSGAMRSERVVVAEPDPVKRETLSAGYGVTCVDAGRAAVSDADVVIIAVKPQVFDVAVADFADALAGRLVVSIAAGLSCARIETLLPAGTAVVRVMPNTPALVGSGMALISGGTEASADDLALVERLFSAVGECLVIEERHQDAGTAISGSGPAYFAMVVDALSRAGVAQGLSRDVAQRLAVATMLGTARLLDETGMHPEELVDGVSSPGGTTIAAVERLEAGGLRSAFADAVGAAVRRSRELGS